MLQLAYLGLVLLCCIHTVYTLPGMPIWQPEPDVIDGYDFTKDYTAEDAELCLDPLYMGMGCRVAHCEDFMAQLRDLNARRMFDGDDRAGLIISVWGRNHADSGQQACIDSVLKKARSAGALRAFHTRPARCLSVQEAHPGCLASDCDALLNGFREYNRLGLQQFRLVTVFNIWGRDYLDSQECIEASLEEATAEGIYQVSHVVSVQADGRPTTKMYVFI